MAPPRPSKSMVISTIFDNCGGHAFSTSHSNAISTNQTSPRVPSAPFQSGQFCLASAATTQIIRVAAAATIVGEIGQTVRVRGKTEIEIERFKETVRGR
ncbi:hypothetical protein HN51_003102 [Arachis hypogaea]